MNTSLDCIPCFLRQALEAARRMTDDASIHERLVREVVRMTAELDLSRTPPVIGQAIHGARRELVGHEPWPNRTGHVSRLCLARRSSGQALQEAGHLFAHWLPQTE